MQQRTPVSTAYGATLPLRLALALRVARAIGERAQSSRLVNACYPDASNEVLARLGHDVACGIGNVATLAATYAAQLGVEAPRRLRMLAHHRQVAAAIAGRSRLHPPRVWIDGAAQCTPDALPDVRLPAGPSLAGRSIFARPTHRSRKRCGKASRRGARAMTRSSRSIPTSCRARRWIGRAAIGFGGGPGAADLNHGVARACRAVAADEAAFRRKQDVWREAEQMRRLAAQQLAGD